VGAVCAAAAGCGAGQSTPQPQPRTAAAAAPSATPAAAATPLPRSARCPRSKASRPAKQVAIALGDGPAYPVLGMEPVPPSRRGIVRLYENARSGSVYRHKTLWAVGPDAKSELVITGASLRTGVPLRFLIGKPARVPGYETVDRLVLPDAAGSWRYAVSATLLHGPGCYAFYVSGHGVNDRLAFRAALNSPG
jgi:hypothetical protein